MDTNMSCNDGSISVLTCPTHNKPQRSICLDCSTLLCEQCAGSEEHHDHRCDNIDSIKKSISAKDYQQLWCTPRLNLLWTTLQQCSETYQSLQQTERQISSHFEHMFKTIMAQEHRIKTPIKLQITRIQAMINSIVQEINGINAIINMTPPSTDSTDGQLQEDELDKVVSSISSSKSIEQFIKSTSSSTAAPSLLDEFGFDAPKKLNDMELMTMIKNHAQQMKLNQHEVGLNPTLIQLDCHIKTDIFQLKNLKMQIQSCLERVGPEPGFNNHVAVLQDNVFSMYSLFTSKITPIKHTFKNLSTNDTSHFTSMVYAAGSVYAFGGPENSHNSFYRYTLAKNQCHEAPMVGIEGSTFISACYDGDKHIYLIGGRDGKNYLDRVDRFNIETQQFSNVGHLPNPIGMAFVYFHNDVLYIIGGSDNDDRCYGRLMAYNLQTHAIQYLMPKEQKSMMACCFDGSDNFYICYQDAFIRYTLSTKEKTNLAAPKERMFFGHLVYDRLNGSILAMGLGTTHHLYTIRDNSWWAMDEGKDKQNRRPGACLILDR